MPTIDARILGTAASHPLPAKRMMTGAAPLGALLGACALAMAIASAWKNPAPREPAENHAVVDPTTDAWPICTSMASLGERADWAQLDPDFALGLQALAREDWTGAISMLAPVALRDARNADIQNYLGYAYYRLRRLDAAFEHYRLALTLNPRQRSAHEHLGEAYLVVGNLPKAQEHLAALERICLIPCEQYDGLRRAIDKYRSRERQGLTDPAL
jgi:tetratricopeptide (TPR) repeat protein